MFRSEEETMEMDVKLTNKELFDAIRSWLTDLGVPIETAFIIRHADHGELSIAKLSVEFKVEAPHMTGPYR
jgi:hypothetical protein